MNLPKIILTLCLRHKECTAQVYNSAHMPSNCPIAMPPEWEVDGSDDVLSIKIQTHSVCLAMTQYELLFRHSSVRILIDLQVISNTTKVDQQPGALIAGWYSWMHKGGLQIP